MQIAVQRLRMRLFFIHGSTIDPPCVITLLSWEDKSLSTVNLRGNEIEQNPMILEDILSLLSACIHSELAVSKTTSAQFRFIVLAERFINSRI